MRRALPLIFIAFVAAPGAFAAERFNLPEGAGRELVYGHCQTCHDLQSVVDSAGIRAGAWNALLDNMKEYGLRISKEQRAKILDYLGTYMGPKPPPAAAAPAMAEAQPTADGAQVFQDTCIACHQEKGVGKPGEFPPLAKNSDLFLSPDFPAMVVLHGLEGPIKAGPKPINNTMPSFDFLSDAEVAAVLNYVRSQWGNDALAPAGMPKLTTADVATARKKSMSSKDVHALRQKLRH